MNRSFKITVGLAATILLGASQFQNCSSPILTEVPDPPKSVDVKVSNYCPPANASLKEVFASNHSAFLYDDNFIPDWDRDGLSDQYETNIKERVRFDIHVSSNDTNGDSYSDLMNVRMGFDSENQFRLTRCDTGLNDNDFDGLTDCEEAALESDPLRPDTDGDGIPDGVELRYSLNPNDPADASIDADHDGLSNLLEVKANSPLKQTNTIYTKNISLGYQLENYQAETGENCYDLTVSNIPVMDVTNGNYVRIYFYETHLSVSGTQTEELSQLQQLNIVIDRNVIHDFEIEIQKDNSNRRQFEVVNVEDIQ